MTTQTDWQLWALGLNPSHQPSRGESWLAVNYLEEQRRTAMIAVGQPE